MKKGTSLIELDRGYVEVDAAEEVFTVGGKWEEPLKKKAKIYMVTGPANSGKSTFCRFLLNRHHAHPTYLLDIDCGQPNYTLPGQVSLTRDHHMSTVKVVKSYFLNCNNPSDKPELYLDAIASLIKTFTL